MKRRYKDQRWIRKRKAILSRDGYRCQISARYGKNVPADTVHHIFPLTEYPQFWLCDWNLISVSREAHDRMHDRNTGKLTEEGEALMKRTARKRGIEVETERREEANQTILVIGEPGSGKTTWAKNNMGDGIVYDLDAIEAAFRLKRPKEERHEPSRWLANKMATGFANAAHEFTDRVIIIRTAPKIEEVEDIEPTKIVVIRRPGDRNIESWRLLEIQKKIKMIMKYAEEKGIATEEVCDEK